MSQVTWLVTATIPVWEEDNHCVGVTFSWIYLNSKWQDSKFYNIFNTLHFITLHIIYIHSLIHAIFIFWIFRLFINFKTVPNKNINSNIIDFLSNYFKHHWSCFKLNLLNWSSFFPLFISFFQKNSRFQDYICHCFESKNEIFQNSGC